MEFLSSGYRNLNIRSNFMLSIATIIFLFILYFKITEMILELFNMKVEKKRKNLFSTVMALFTIGMKLVIPLLYFKIINIIALLVIMVMLVMFRQPIEKCILASTTCCIILVNGEILFSKIFIFIYSVTLNINNSFIIPIYRLFLIFNLNILVMVIYGLIKKFDFKLTVHDNLNYKNKSLIVLECCICCGLMIFNAFEFMYSNNLNKTIILLNTIALSLFYLKNVLNSTKLQEVKVKIKTLDEHNKNLNVLYDETRSFKHDFSNIIQAIGGYIDTENVKGLKAMHTELIKDLKEINNVEILNPNIINNPAIYNILNSKYHIAREADINMNIEVLLDLDNLEINTLDFCRILGILLDNAIEAARECEKKEISVRFMKDFRVNRNLVIVENTYQNLDLDINRLFEKEYTSKKEKKSHGLGLWKVKKILEKNNNLNLYSFKGEKFVQQLEIYNEITSKVHV